MNRPRDERYLSVMFVCFGNICRSPMAEFVFADMAQKAGLGDRVHAASAATNCEEGRPVHPETLKVLRAHGVRVYPKKSVLLTPDDAERYDLFVGMDEYNIRAMRRILGEGVWDRIVKMGDFTSSPRDIADPWYTGDFDATYADVSECAAAMLQKLFGEEINESKDK